MLLSVIVWLLRARRQEALAPRRALVLARLKHRNF
jgi:hypothetical protein